MRFITIILLFATGCASWPSGNWHLRQAKRQIKKAELKGAHWAVDSVIVKDTVFVSSVYHDTVSVLLPGDSIVIEKERLKVVVKRIKGDTVKVLAECKPQIIIRNIPVKVYNEIKAEKSGMPWWGWAIIAFLCLVVLRLALR